VVDDDSTIRLSPAVPLPPPSFLLLLLTCNMNAKNVTCAHSAPTHLPPHNNTAAPAAVDCGPNASGSSRLLLYLRVVATFCWAGSRGTLQRLFFSYLQSIVIRIWTSLVVVPRRAPPGQAKPVVANRRTRQRPQHSPVGTRAAALSAPTTSPKKVAWSYLRGTYVADTRLTYDSRKKKWTDLRHFAGVSLALSELCQECNYGGRRIPLSAILDLSKFTLGNARGFFFWCSIVAYDYPWRRRVVRQHQSAFVPLGPHVEKDVPRRLVQLVGRFSVPSRAVDVKALRFHRQTRMLSFLIRLRNMSSLRR
jgi:hypothetical protein